MRIVERAAALGYRGFAGLDMAVCADGGLRVFDLNFRLNGSTVAVLLHGEIHRTRGTAVMRLRSLRATGRFDAMIGAAREAVARGLLVPLATYRPPGGSEPGGAPGLLGLVLGRSRDEVARHEEELTGWGLAAHP
jgi:hypothetical protein